MRGADQTPFTVGRLETAPDETPVAAIGLDVAEDGLDRGLALSVEGLIVGIDQLLFHALANKGRIKKTTSMCSKKLSDLER